MAAIEPRIGPGIDLRLIPCGIDVSVSSSTGTVQRVHKRFAAIEELIERVPNADLGQ